MSHKRKLEDDLGPNNVSSISENELNSDSAITAVATTVISRTDEEEINSIVTTRLSSDNVEDVVDAMNSLAKLLYSKENGNFAENRKLAFRRGAPITIVQAMSRRKNDDGASSSVADIQSNGCLALARISCCKFDNISIAQDIIAVGGLKGCLAAMEQRSDDNNDNKKSTNIQSYGCLLIHNLWICKDVRKNVVDEGGLKAVVNAMTDFDQDATVQRSGCFALKALLWEEHTWAEAVINAGCAGLVITAMNNHANDPELQVHGCEFLSRISKVSEDYRNMILKDKCLVPIVEALRIHNDNNKVKVAAQHAMKTVSG
jgi:hypothetical protein